MRPRRSKRIQIERGTAPNLIPSVSVDAATAARQYGPLGYGAAGPVPSIGEFYDVRAFQEGGPPSLYEGTAPWFQGLERPVRQPSALPPRQEPPEASAHPPTPPVSYRGEEVDFAGLMHAFMARAEAMNPSTYGTSPDVPGPAMPSPGEGMTGPAMEAMIGQIAMNEPAHYQSPGPAPEAVMEPMSVFDQAAQMDVAGMAPMPAVEDGLAAFMSSMAEPWAALAEQQQEQASQSLEAMVQDQMSLMGPAPVEDPSLMQQQMMDMMLLTGFGPGM